MVSKTNLEAKLADLQVQLKEVNDCAAGVGEQYDTLKAEHDRVLRDNAAHRERERARMRHDHAEQQRKRREAECEDKRKRRQELSDGMLRLKDATEWAIVSDDNGRVLELTVPLSEDVEPIVHGVLTKKAETKPWRQRLGDAGTITFATGGFDPISPTMADLLRHGVRI